MTSWRTPAGPLPSDGTTASRPAGEGRQDVLGCVGDGIELGRGEPVHEELTHGGDVPRCGGFDLAAASGSGGDERAPSIGGKGTFFTSPRPVMRAMWCEARLFSQPST